VQLGDRRQQFVGPQHGQLHESGDAGRSGGLDEVQLVIGLVRAHRAEQEHGVDAAQRRRQRGRVGQIDRDRLVACAHVAVGLAW
jgi:hypothetical protein